MGILDNLKNIFSKNEEIEEKVNNSSEFKRYVGGIKSSLENSLSMNTRNDIQK